MTELLTQKEKSQDARGEVERYGTSQDEPEKMRMNAQIHSIRYSRLLPGTHDTHTHA